MRKKRIITKEELINIGKDVFSEKGYFLSKVSDIVKKAGVCQGTYYLHFESKKDILAEIINEFHKDVYKILFEENYLYKDYSDLLIKKELNLFNYFMENYKTTLLIFREGYGEIEFVEKLTKIHEEMTKSRKDILEKLMNNDDVKAELYGYILGGILRGVFMYAVEKKLTKERYIPLLKEVLENFLKTLNLV
ncbi:MAG: TetR/AcrR family transcriptional regulator [Proteobacteria bacterium]|nr:TetR/AcrR family transcriptional regulator [Pseudomonadota bacterium]